MRDTEVPGICGRGRKSGERGRRGVRFGPVSVSVCRSDVRQSAGDSCDRAFDGCNSGDGGVSSIGPAGRDGKDRDAALHGFQQFLRSDAQASFEQFSFRYFGDDNAGFGYYTEAKFREISVHVELLNLWKWLGFQLLVNRFPRFRKFWEFYLCYLIRGKAMEFVFEPVGPPISRR